MEKRELSTLQQFFEANREEFQRRINKPGWHDSILRNLAKERKERERQRKLYPDHLLDLLNRSPMTC